MPGWRRILALLIAAALVAVGVLVLGRLTDRGRGGAGDVADALWLRDADVNFWPSVSRAVLSIVAVGLGVALGREGAPQTVGAGVASKLAEWTQLPRWQRRLLVASGAGAGFAAVYNVPLGGSLFALEVLLGAVALPLVLPALATSVIATAVAWTTLGTGPTYTLPHYTLHATQMVWALLAGAIIGFAGLGWVRLVEAVAARRPRRWGRYVAPVVAFGILGVASMQYPQLLGNGKDVVQLGALGRLSLGLMVVLVILRPLATAACLGSGSPGGLFTPTLTVGVLLAGVLGTLWNHVWPGGTLGSYAVIGGGAFLAAAMQGPLSGLVLILELTRNFDSLMCPTILAVVEATVVARRFGAPSIYSARLHLDDEAASTPAAGAATIDILDGDGDLRPAGEGEAQARSLSGHGEPGARPPSGPGEPGARSPSGPGEPDARPPSGPGAPGASQAPTSTSSSE